MTLVENLQNVQSKIAVSAKKSGRNHQDICIVAVTKTHSVETIESAMECGLQAFGENYVQEALPKIEKLSANSKPIQWHFIGHLQTNKVKTLVGKFDLIHSVDRASLVNELAARCAQKGVRQKILVEVNLAGEVSKNGVSASELAPLIQLIAQKESLQLCGLMFMPPLNDSAAEARTYFSKARDIFFETKGKVKNSERFIELSMGTSHDFEIAIEHGATLVRLGTVLFGRRPTKQKEQL